MLLISICVCTYKRIFLLKNLLCSLSCLKTGQKFDYEIIVVDNDVDKSAQPYVLDIIAINGCKNIVYDVEPEQNIALARNRCVEHARGEYVAFIDDDECPSSEWLINLYSVITELKADAVMGPVIPVYPPSAPQWIIQGRFFERPNPADRSRVYAGRTSNALVKACWFKKFCFDPSYGLTGGSDHIFFKNLLNSGGTIYWSKEGYVKEYIEEGRLNLKWLLARAFRGGQGEARSKYDNLLSVRIIPHLAYRACLCLVALIASIVLFPLGLHKGVWWLRKVFSNAGQISIIFPYRYKEYRKR